MASEEQGRETVEPPDDGAAAVIAPTKKPAPPERKPKELPPFKVLLHNDDVNSFDHVIRSIMRLTPISEDEAVVKTIEAHETGVALLLVTHLERAELYVEQFASLGITCTVESDHG
jgi:ATP-dependent Clp protease adaptor protein ClpS